MNLGAWTDPNPQVDVAAAEYARLLGFPIHRALEGRALELAESARAWYRTHGRPWIWVSAPFHVTTKSHSVVLGAEEFHSERLRLQWETAGVQEAILVAASAGPELEARAAEFWKEEKPDEYFFLETFGSAVVEHLVTAAGARLCASAEASEMAVLPHYSPGYTGWDVADQPGLFRVFTQASNGLPGALQVLESGMLVPKKSQLAVFGVTRFRDRVRGQLVPCENCGFPNCQFRRTPYRNLPESPPAAEKASVLKGNGYRTSLRALRKWSGERLELVRQADHTVTARFRFDGTTCSNMGYPLVFDYVVTLTGPAEGYRILEALCAPSTGDTGYRKMCSFLEKGERFMGEIRQDLPLVGSPLESVFEWPRENSPAGCFCDEGSRRHKWGLVLETIHYALVQGEKSGNQKV